jgi:hypothetical protein
MKRTLLLTVVVGLCAATASAGALNGHAAAFNDGNGPSGGAWTGSTAFNNGQGLSGYVDWAVFGPGSFPYAGYTPTAGELAYSYQVFSTGSLATTSFSASLDNVADSIGTFNDLLGDVPTNMLLIPAQFGSATWSFAGIPISGNSMGLVFSSIKVPKNLFGSTIDGGTGAIVIPLPSPDVTDVPEPATMSLLALAGLAMLRRRRA